jgi:hypothetical protein
MDGLIAFSAVRGKQLLPLVKVNDLHRQYRADRGGRAPPITVPQNHWRYYVNLICRLAVRPNPSNECGLPTTGIQSRPKGSLTRHEAITALVMDCVS